MSNKYIKSRLENLLYYDLNDKCDKDINILSDNLKHKYDTVAFSAFGFGTGASLVSGTFDYVPTPFKAILGLGCVSGITYSIKSALSLKKYSNNERKSLSRELIENKRNGSIKEGNRIAAKGIVSELNSSHMDNILDIYSSFSDNGLFSSEKSFSKSGFVSYLIDNPDISTELCSYIKSSNSIDINKVDNIISSYGGY